MYVHHSPAMLPSPPLPEPAKLSALTHRPRAWAILRYLGWAGNGIPMPRVTH